MALDEVFRADAVLMLRSQLEKARNTQTELNNSAGAGLPPDSPVQ